MRARPFALVALAAASAACGGPKKAVVAQAPRPPYLAGIPTLPQAVVQDTSGGADFAHLLYLAPVPMDSAAAFYRHRLAALGWHAIASVGDSTLVSLYLEKEGRPLWVQIRAGGLACQVSLTAAGAADSARATPPTSGP